ncbi:hypothetical protein HY970_04185 [Candidatus Kaiserbacteria bacterium]|nr:hypothetical protein [Candidatus Kaiserbacteria bacterium]
MTQVKTTNLIGLLVVVAIVVGLLLALSNISKQQRVIAISTFQECKAAGYPVMESYPEQCITPDGRSFENTEQRSQMDQPGRMPTNNVGEGCALAGCSSIVCASAEDASTIITTCEYRAEYACYKTARCEKQANGTCGWTQTNELKSCLKNPPPLDRGHPEVY